MIVYLLCGAVAGASAIGYGISKMIEIRKEEIVLNTKGGLSYEIS